MSATPPEEISSGSPTSCRPGGGCGCGGGSKMLFLAVAVLALLYWSTTRYESSGPAGPPPAGWAKDYEAALSTASTQSKPVLLDFGATWCGPCRWMEKEVFSKPETAKALSGWVPVHIDIDANRTIAAKYDVQGVPTLITLTPDGTEIGRSVGALPVEEFAGFLASAEAKLPASQPAQAAAR